MKHSTRMLLFQPRYAINLTGVAGTTVYNAPLTASTWYCAFTYTHTSGAFTAGLYNNSAATGNPLVGIMPTTTEFKLQIGATTVEAYTLTAGTSYQVVIDYDGTYVRWSIKGGTEYTVWTEIYRSSTITVSGTLYLAVVNTTAIASFQNIMLNSGAYGFDTVPSRSVTLRFSSAAAFTFDPTITTSAGTATWVFGDGTSVVGNAISVSKTGYMLVKVTGVVASVILTLDASTDNLAGDIVNINPPGLTTITDLRVQTNPLLTGGLSNLSALTLLTYLHFGGCTLLGGNLSSLSALTLLAYFNGSNCTLLAGNLSNLSACTKIQTCYLYATAIDGTAGLGSIPTLRDVRVYGCSWTQAECDAVLLDLWNNRMAFTYASTINLDIKAGNTTPSGVFQIPADCNNPTALEAAYELENDSCSDGHKLWNTDYP